MPAAGARGRHYHRLMIKRSIALALILAAALGTAAAETVRGEVLEARDADIYTYMRLKTANGETWAAVPKTAVVKGSQVAITDAMVMNNFKSNALGQTFDKIVFGSIATGGAAAAAHGGGTMAQMPMGMPAPAVTAPATAIKVTKAKGKDARTVAEVVGGKDKLKDKAVTVRAQVVKANFGIKGKNWLHLQDGSGNAGAGTNDIAVITNDKAAVGDVVTIKGTVRTKVVIGPGYEYDVLVDSATVSK